LKHSLCILLLCTAAAALSCPTGQARDEATLAEIERTWAQALEKHDANALGCILADEFEDADIHGELTDKNATMNKLASSRVVHHELSDLHAHLHRDFAYIRGIADAVDPQTRKDTRVRFTDIYVFREGRWQCVAGHESLVSGISN